jgi:hypothetical protein
MGGEELGSERLAAEFFVIGGECLKMGLHIREQVLDG